MIPQRATPNRLFAATGLLVAATMSSLVFYGTAANLLVLAMVAAALLSSLVCVGLNGLLSVLEANRAGVALALAMLGYLVIAYRLSLSPDNSFAASWVLAAGPLAFISGSVVARDRAAYRVLSGALVFVVVALAANSSARFVYLGERAHQPLIDPNNYAALMYLIWIPLAHWHILRGWQHRRTNRYQHVFALVSTFVLVLAIMATRSRTSLLIVSGAFCIWALIAAVRRLSPRHLFAHLGVAALALGVAFFAIALPDATSKGLEFGGGLSIRSELIHSALAMFRQRPLGVGVFCFPLLYPSFRSPLEQETAGLFVHNDYVQFLVEGGLPLLMLLVLFAAAVLRRGFGLIRVAPEDPRFENLGVAMALVAICLHALINFVFYSLSLSIVVGLLGARMFSRPTQEPNRTDLRVARRAIAAGLITGWVMWLYLALDVAVVGVFQDQPSLGLGASIRANEHGMLEFARIAQRFNGNRGIPALGEALLLYRAARAEPDSQYLREQAYRQYRHAIAVDPWNMLAYVQFSQFLDELPRAEGRASGESDEELLLSALAIDPLFVPALDRLLEHYAESGQDAQRYALLRNLVYPWMLTLRRSDADASDRYFDLLDGYARANGDQSFRDEVQAKRKEIGGVAPSRQSLWFL